MSHPSTEVEYFGNRRTAKKFLIASHGLPGFKSNGNRDFLQKLANESSYFCILFPLPNLKNGQFTFDFSILNTINLAKKELSIEPNLSWDILAHSWGAIPCIQLARDTSVHIKKVCLIAPYTRLPTQEPIVNSLIEGLNIEYPNLLLAKPLNEHIRDFLNVQKTYDPLKYSKDLSEKVSLMVLQPKDDSEVSDKDILEYVKICGPKTRLQQVDTDHSLTLNRESVFSEICEFLNA